jgi:hypothetical protein
MIVEGDATAATSASGMTHWITKFDFELVMKIPFESCLVVETKVGHSQWSTFAEATACAGAVSAIALDDWMQR